MTSRSREQLAVMLKLIDVNNISLTRSNIHVKQKIWQTISEKLNELPGAHKDVDGWKRSYSSWRINVGNNFKKESQKLINTVTDDDDYFCINATDSDVDDEDDNNDDPTLSLKNPTDEQKMRLHELVTEHVQILQSTADDEPLKRRLWLNITNELNSLPGALIRTPSEWKKGIDWEKYKAPRGRKSHKRPASIKAETNVKRFIGTLTNGQHQDSLENVEFKMIDHGTMNSQTIQYKQEEYDNIDELIVEEPELQSLSGANTNHFEQQTKQQIFNLNDNDVDLSEEDIDELLNKMDDAVASELTDDEFSSEYKTQNVRPPLTPIVKSFKLSNRIAIAVEKLSSDMDDIKELLKKSTDTLGCLEQVLQQQCTKQDETNALLRRNGQLLKVLVEYKSGRRTNK